jgi:hypothetical protein
MMKPMKNLIFGLLMLFLLIGFTACEKEQTENDAEQTGLAENDVIAENAFDEISAIADEAFEQITGGLKSTDNGIRRLGPCVTITIDTTVMPRVLTIDFGEENCLCNDGKWRRGMIIVTFTGRYHQPGTVITHNLENYHVNDNHVQGTKVMTNLGPNTNGQPEYSRVVNGSITFHQTGFVISWESDHLRTWIEGYDTPAWWDNVYLIAGSGTHSNSNGGGFERTIIEPLRREASCSNIVSGIVETVPANRPTRILDYGDGTCDNLATLTIGDQTFIIRLP